MSQNLGTDIAAGFGFTSDNQPSNYYAEAANRIMQPAREQAISGIAAEKGEAENTANQRNQIQGISGPMAVENQERNDRLVGEAGNRQLNALDEQGRQAAYVAAEKDRQENLAMQTARTNTILNGFKMGAGLISGAVTGGVIPGIGNILNGWFNSPSTPHSSSPNEGTQDAAQADEISPE